MAIDPFQARVAQLALAVAAGQGFALAGGNALVAHGLLTRPTEDVDLFTPEPGGPGGWPPPAGSDASVADLIAATHCETPGRGHSAAFDPTPDTTADVERLEHTRDEGVER